MSKVNHEAQAGLAHVAIKRTAAIGRVGIVGANRAGIGIALRFLDADIPVTVFELTRTSLDQGIALARSAWQEALLDGRLADAGRDRRMALLAGAINLHHLKDCDLVIDAVSTEGAVKGELFRRLDDSVKPDAILVTLGSRSEVDHLAGCTRRPGEVVGLHVASAPGLGATWTPVPGKRSSGQSVATVSALVHALQGAGAAAWLEGGDAGDEHGGEAWQVDQALE